MHENKYIFRLLQFSTIFVFLGRAWQHFFFSGPYRELLWDEKRFAWVAKYIFGQKWSVWTTNLNVDRAVDVYNLLVSLMLLAGVIAVVFVAGKVKLLRFIIKLCVFLLLILALVDWKDRFFNMGQLFEYTIQLSAPVFLLWWSSNKVKMPSFFLWLRIMIAFTFVSHGFYAIGFYPVPGIFSEMTMSILHLSEEGAISFLKIMGALDFIAAVFILTPFPRLIKIGLIYCAIWGILTALARPVAFYYQDFWLESLHQWVYQALFRMPHGILPIIALLMIRTESWALILKWKIRAKETVKNG